MAEVTNELIYEVLKQMQGDIGRLDRGLMEIKAELVSVRVHIVAIQNDINNIYTILGDHGARLDRIERRLELADVH
jgi:septal ring factor EnvC (AmiA/AmiB activator)